MYDTGYERLIFYDRKKEKLFKTTDMWRYFHFLSSLKRWEIVTRERRKTEGRERRRETDESSFRVRHHTRHHCRHISLSLSLYLFISLALHYGKESLIERKYGFNDAKEIIILLLHESL